MIKEIQRFMDKEIAARRASREYGGYFYIFNGKRFLGKYKNNASGLNALMAAFLTNTDVSIPNTTSFTFEPSNYDSSTASYTIATNNYPIQINSAIGIDNSSNYGGGQPTAAISSDGSTLSLAINFGTISSGTTITSVSINISNPQGEVSAPLIQQSSLSIPFDNNLAVVITWALIL